MDAEIKKFIEENIDLIEHGEFEELYQALNDRYKVPNLTETLLGADINPAKYMKEIPEEYLRGSTIQSYVIPNNITSIGDEAFYCCRSLTNIMIPDSVKTIGGSAFYGCSGLTSVAIENNVTSIGGSAFYNCSGLTSITIPNSVTIIYSCAFKGCSSITSIEIPDSVISIGDYVFKHTKNLESINYLGTKDQWNKIKLRPLWNKDSRIERVECTDGVIELK